MRCGMIRKAMTGAREDPRKPDHPMIREKIERYQRSMKDVIKLWNFEYSLVLEEAICEFVEYPGLRPGQATTSIDTTKRLTT